MISSLRLELLKWRRSLQSLELFAKQHIWSRFTLLSEWTIRPLQYHCLAFLNKYIQQKTCGVGLWEIELFSYNRLNCYFSYLRKCKQILILPKINSCLSIIWQPLYVREYVRDNHQQWLIRLLRFNDRYN